MKQLSLRKQVHNSFRVFFYTSMYHRTFTLQRRTFQSYLAQCWSIFLELVTNFVICPAPVSDSLVTAGDQSVATNLHKRNEKRNKALQHATNAPTCKLVCSPHNIVRNRTSLATGPPFLTFHTILHSPFLASLSTIFYYSCYSLKNAASPRRHLSTTYLSNQSYRTFSNKTE
jgi:hypothetical protein